MKETKRVVLAVDVGGSHVKALTSREAESRRVLSGADMTAADMVTAALALADGWEWDVVSVGVPAPVHGGQLVSDPFNLGEGWAGFGFESAFGKPTRLINDAAMQALGSYGGGRMLFLGLGTGLGSTLIVDGLIEPMELAHLPFKKHTYEDYLGERGRKRRGKARWEAHVHEAAAQLAAALEPDYLVLGGGNAEKLTKLPPKARLGSNADAFKGGFRLWDDAPS